MTETVTTVELRFFLGTCKTLYFEHRTDIETKNLEIILRLSQSVVNPFSF